MGDSDSPPIKKKKVGRPPSKPHVAGPGRGHDRERIADQSIANALDSKLDSFSSNLEQKKVVYH